MKEAGEAFADLMLDLPLERPFTYRVPRSLSAQVSPGSLVCAPFRDRRVLGTVLVIHDSPPEGQEAKEILHVLSEGPVFTPSDLAWYQWISQYYLHPLGKVLGMAFPPGLGAPHRLRCVALSPKGELCLREGGANPTRLGPRQRELVHILARQGETSIAVLEGVVPGARAAVAGLEKRGLLRSRSVEVQRRPFVPEEGAGPSPPLLTAHQTEAMDRIGRAMQREAFQGFLLWGVTASGKTEIYLRAAEVCLNKGRQAMVLVPEISLTHQLVRDFRSRFGEKIAVLHSRLSQGERCDVWREVHRWQLPIVLGARSALFAPCRDLGLIIVDEEHEAAYKQEEGLRYHARDLALMRGKFSKGVVLLGSATPAMETFHNARKGKIAALELPERVEGRPLPSVEIVDLRRQRTPRGGRGILSRALQQAMEEALGRGEQILLFLNRRGFATFLLCQDCGHVFQCPNCAVTLVHHRSERALRCHYCGWGQPAPALCPACQGMGVTDLGMGTETIEEAVRERFPGARVLRMDRDTTARKHAQREMLSAWRRGEADVLVGTQMVAKGHHVPNVTLVGVILADISLNLPDFRAAERTFQLLLQVAGRAGRGDRPGRVIIQTFHPRHPSVLFSAAQDYRAFVAQELQAREEAGYPPFRHLILFRLMGPGEEETASAARLVGEIARKICRKREGVACLGPSPAALARLKGRYRWQLLLKGKARGELHRAARQILELGRQGLSRSRVRLTVDVDPQSFL
jgi:primosomal protein N' (replication factor Y)